MIALLLELAWFLIEIAGVYALEKMMKAFLGQRLSQAKPTQLRYIALDSQFEPILDEFWSLLIFLVSFAFQNTLSLITKKNNVLLINIYHAPTHFQGQHVTTAAYEHSSYARLIHKNQIK